MNEMETPEVNALLLDRLAQPEHDDSSIEAFAFELGIDIAQVRAASQAGSPRATFSLD